MDAGQFNNMGSDYVLTSGEYSSTIVNHAQTIVGYDDAKTVAGSSDVGAFKVVNSWGTSFGNKGYYWITYAAFEEIGSKLQLTYITDKTSYQPTLLAVWQFNNAPTRTTTFTVGLGTPGSTTALTPYFIKNSASVSATFPTFMALDVTSFLAAYQAGTTSFYLTLGSTATAGIISSFYIEEYQNGYSNAATQGVRAIGRCAQCQSLFHYRVVVLGGSTVPRHPRVSLPQWVPAFNCNWSTPASNGGSALTTYKIYRGTSSGAETYLASVSASSLVYTDTTAVVNQIYYYQVTAVNAIGESSRSSEASGNIPISVPSTPTSMTATAGTSYIDLSWSTNGANTTGFHLTAARPPVGSHCSRRYRCPPPFRNRDSTATAGTTVLSPRRCFQQPRLLFLQQRGVRPDPNRSRRPDLARRHRPRVRHSSCLDGPDGQRWFVDHRLQVVSRHRQWSGVDHSHNHLDRDRLRRPYRHRRYQVLLRCQGLQRHRKFHSQQRSHRSGPNGPWRTPPD